MAMRRLLLISGLFLVLGVVVATGAISTSDEAVRGVYLSPADTTNGDSYAEIGTNGEFQIEMAGLNPDATTVADDVFEISTDHDEARVWIEDGESSVTFYRMDTGGAIEQSGSAAVLEDGESLLVGLKVQSGTESVVLESITVHAEVPETSGSSGSGDNSGGSAPTTATETQTATETPTDTPTDTPVETSTATETPTPTASPTDESTPVTQTDTATPTSDGGTPTPTDAASETPTATSTDAGGGAEPTETGSAQFEIVELRASPENPRVGERIEVTATVANVDSREITTTHEIRAGGESIAAEEVTLAPGEQFTLTGTITFDEPGSYEIAFGSSSITVRVNDGGPLTEVGGLASSLLIGLLILLGAFLLLAVYRRSNEEEHEEEIAS